MLGPEIVLTRLLFHGAIIQSKQADFDMVLRPDDEVGSVEQSELSKAELLEKLRASKRPVTSRQLERWSKAGLIARPQRRHLPGVRGSVSFFRTEAFAQAAGLFDAAQRAKGRVGDRRLDKRAFLLWWSGERIAQNSRALLLKTIAPLFKSLERIRAEAQTTIVEHPGEDDDASFDAAEAFVERHGRESIRVPVLRATRKNLGRSESDFASLMVAGLTIALGGMPVFGSSHIDGEPSLESLFARAFKLQDLPSSENTNPEEQVPELLEPARIFANVKELEAFVLGLSDAELETARKFTRVFVEDMPTIFEAYGVLVGRNPFQGLMQFAAQSQSYTKAQIIIAVAWLIRRHGSANCESIIQQVEQNRSNVQALCMLAKAFPEHRTLLLKRNATRLAALPEETRQKMLDSVKQFIPKK
jgi:hypothetical protein